MNFGPIFAEWALFANGLVVTLLASFFGSMLAIVIAVVLGIVSQLGHRRAEVCVRAYVYLFRGTPLLVLLFFSFYALPSVGIVLSAETAGVLALGLISGAYMVEVVRSALQSVDVSQRESAQIDGASNWIVMTRVIFPQAAPQMIAPCTNEVTALIMATSLLSVISVGDLVRSAQLVVGIYLIPFEAYVTLAVLYLLSTGVVTRLSIKFERWLAVSLFT